MSADFKTVLIRDSKLNDITDSIVYGVKSGASSSTFQQFVATTQSTSQLAFNVTVPSESVVLNREVLINATYRFTISASNAPQNANVLDYGNAEAFQAFPLNASFNTLSASINNSNVSVNLKDVLPQLIKMMTQRDLQRYSNFTPTLPDGGYKYYSDSDNTSALNNVLATYKKAGHDIELLPRGAHPFKIIDVVHTSGATVDKSLISLATTDTWLITCEAEFTEPLFLSPFIYGGSSDYNNQGLVGVNNFSVTANIDTSLSRFFSTAKGYYTALTLTNITNARLLVNFLTSQPTHQINARNIVPYIDVPRYITTYNSNIAAAGSATIVSQNIQLNQIPDYFLICVRKPMSQQVYNDTSTFLPIRSISVNFNNSSGLLSSAQPADLWRISKNNGSQQNWLEFFGYAGNTGAGGSTTVVPTYSVPTGGSMLVISPSSDLSLPAYLTSGSIGQYNFQINVNVINNTLAQLAPELVIVAVNSGIFTTVAGSSAIYTGILTKEMVMDAQNNKSENVFSSVQYQRLVGGSISNMVASAMKAIPHVKTLIDNISSGGARCGGAMSGGVSSSSSYRSKLDNLSY
jgi:hypothetical protein